MKNCITISILLTILLSHMVYGQSTLPEKSKQDKVYLESRSEIAKEALEKIGVDEIIVDKEAGGFYDVGYRFKVHGVETFISQTSHHNFFFIHTRFYDTKLTLEDANDFNKFASSKLTLSVMTKSTTAELETQILFSGGITIENVVSRLKAHFYDIRELAKLIEKSK